MTGRSSDSSYPPKFDPEIVKAIHWCRLGRVRPDDDATFSRAKQLGLLAQDPIWRATEKGEGVLIALGLLDGEPASERAAIVVLWAACEQFSTPQFVASWSDALDDCFPEEADRQREEAEVWFKTFGDEKDWHFWTTREHIVRPSAEAAPQARNDE